LLTAVDCLERPNFDLRDEAKVWCYDLWVVLTVGVSVNPPTARVLGTWTELSYRNGVRSRETDTALLLL